jgi:hypothetical protein
MIATTSATSAALTSTVRFEPDSCPPQEPPASSSTLPRATPEASYDREGRQRRRRDEGD